MLSRQLQWPLIILCLLLCGGLIALIISGRQRAWWLLGLAIVLALFVRTFSSFVHQPITMVESPPFVDADHAIGIVGPAQYVAGFQFAGRHYALPYQQITAHPLILLSDQDQRAVVIWSVTANAATVLPVDRSAAPREWEVVSTPADSLLLYDRRLGEFIVGVTGRTVHGARPAGASEPLRTELVPYEQWLAEHPDTQVLALAAAITAPAVPVKPRLHFPTDARAEHTVAILATTQPAAVASESLTIGAKDIRVGKTSVLLTRAAKTSPLRAFDRQTQDDLFLTLTTLKHADKKHPNGVLTDSDSGSEWTLDGRAIDGPLKGTQLRELGVRDGLNWGVMKFWMPELQWVEIK